MLKIYHITHNDLDAVGCAYLLELAFLSSPTELKHYFCSNYDVDDKINELIENDLNNCDLKDYNIAFITDISCSIETFSKLVEKVDVIYVADHHKTNKIIAGGGDKLNLNGEIKVIDAVDYTNKEGQMEKHLISATFILYNLLRMNFSDGVIDTKAITQYFVAELVDAISNYDTWEWTKSEFKEIPDKYHIYSLATLVRMQGPENVVNLLLSCNSFSNYMKKVIENKIEIIDIIQNDAIKHLPQNYKIYTEEDGTIVGYYLSDTSANMSLLHESIFTDLIEDYPILNKVSYTKFLYPANCQLSFRTKRDDVDLAEIAVGFGGGGHRKASGAKLSPDLMIEELKKYYDSMPLNLLNIES